MQPDDHSVVGWGPGGVSRVYEPGRGNTWLALAAWLHAVCQQRTRPKTLIEIGNNARHVVCEGTHRRAELPDRGLHEAG